MADSCIILRVIQMDADMQTCPEREALDIELDHVGIGTGAYVSGADLPGVFHQGKKCADKGNMVCPPGPS